MHVSLYKPPLVRDTRPESGSTAELPRRGKGPGFTWLSALVVCGMAVVLVALFWFPLERMFANVEVNYNEGWNAYRAQMVANRIPIYGERTIRFGTGTAYPPLSFHLIGRLGNANNFVA